MLPDKFYTYVEGGNISNPRINLPSSGTRVHTFMSFVIIFHILTKDSFIDLPINQVI
jgi:hypothetical protein